MTQTPHIEQYKRLPRLYVDGPLANGAVVPLPEGQAHYLKNVMRLSAGDKVRVFNGRDGEWLTALESTGKKHAALMPIENIAAQTAARDLWAVASPVKKEAFEWMIEKATELGVSRFVPVVCDHTVVRRLNEDRAHTIAVEAAEQTERLDLPEIAPLQDLKDVLRTWDPRRKLIFCLERGDAVPIAAALQKVDGPLAVLIGPEGGFSQEEIEFIKTLPFATAVSLGKNILRAETALIAALACVQATSAKQ